MKPTSMNVFLQVAKNIEVTRGKIWIVWRMFNCLPAKSLKLIPHQISSMGTGKRMILSDIIPRCFDFTEHRTSCNVFAWRFTLIVAPHSRKMISRGTPSSWRRRSSWFYQYSYGQLWISLAGENWGVSIVRFAVCSQAQKSGTTFRPLWRHVAEMLTLPRGTTANDRYATILSIVCGSISRCGTHCMQIFRNCKWSLIMACTESLLMPTWTRICSSVIHLFSHIRPSIRAITSGIMARWAYPGCESSCSNVYPSWNLFCHSCTFVRDIQHHHIQQT